MSTIIKPYGDQDPHAMIELIAKTDVVGDTFTTDQMPIMSARVSHAGSGKTGDDPEADLRLMKWLADHKHMTPFEHQSATFKIVAPLFVIREWHRHRTQSYNEMSMRYTDSPVGKFHFPEAWREQATRNKQSSAGNLSDYKQDTADLILKKAYNTSLTAYNDLCDIGVCREQARMVVPVGNYSEFYATANLRNWYGFWLLRHDPDAQKEIRVYADAIDEMLTEIWPESWECLKNS
ncbi:MAG: FAD-dependent thymidylate synthase [Candidatus Peribacteraceae bacterium]|nr:FAD-dependent thymidylate synthase [Candidatus Peribacteraceae bacterium]